jgi:uncharacterized FlgJ-related protein
MLSCRAALVSIGLLAVMPHAAFAAPWGCHGTKPGHPTAEERAAFIREVSELALNAEKTHGVPASALAALAIAESGYGWTRVAIDANNIFAWKFFPAAAEGRKSYRPACQSSSGAGHHFMVFRSRADAFEYVAAKLATLDAYRTHTEAYRAARKRGDAPEVAINAWLAGVAKRYSGEPEAFSKKLLLIMNNPVEPADKISPEQNLYRLSEKAHAGS